MRCKVVRRATPRFTRSLTRINHEVGNERASAPLPIYARVYSAEKTRLYFARPHDQTSTRLHYYTTFQSYDQLIEQFDYMQYLSIIIILFLLRDSWSRVMIIIIFTTLSTIGIYLLSRFSEFARIFV